MWRAPRPCAAIGAPHPRARSTLSHPSSAPEATRGCRRQQRRAAATRPSHHRRCQACRRTWSHPRPRPWLHQAQEQRAGLPRITLLRLRPYTLTHGYRGRCALCGACLLSRTSPTLRDSGQADRPASQRDVFVYSYKHRHGHLQDQKHSEAGSAHYTLPSEPALGEGWGTRERYRRRHRGGDKTPRIRPGMDAILGGNDGQGRFFGR